MLQRLSSIQACSLLIAALICTKPTYIGRPLVWWFPVLLPTLPEAPVVQPVHLDFNVTPPPTLSSPF